jgi:two-component system sensor histidine kinase/response regulator
MCVFIIKMLKQYFFIPFLLLSITGFAKAPIYKTIDSLKSDLKNTLADKSKLNDTATIAKLNKIAKTYLATSPDSAIYYYSMGINIARNIHYDKGVAYGLMQTADIYYGRGNYAIAQQNLNDAIAIYTRLNDMNGISDCYNVFGNLYDQTGQYEKALKYLNKSLKIRVRANDQSGMARIYLGMGNIYDNSGHPSAALDYYFKALFINTKLHKKLAVAANYNNIGVILQNMEIYPKAMEYFHKALSTWRETHKIGGISTAYENIGEVLMAQQKYDEALKFLAQSLKIAEKQDDKDGISSLYSDLGLCFAYKNDFELALAYLNKSLKIATDNKIDYNRAFAFIGLATAYNLQHSYNEAYTNALQAKLLSDKLGSLNLRTTASLQLSNALWGMKQFKNAYLVRKQYDDLRNGLKNDESIQKFTSYNLEASFADKQRQQAAQQKETDLIYKQKMHSQRLINIIFIVVILAMVVTLGVYYREKRKQQKINARLQDKNHEVLQQKSDLDEQASKLNDLNILKDRLISVLAHDLRAPLSTLRGLFSLLQDETITHQQLLDMIPNVLKKLEYTSDFLDTLLFWINSQMENFDSSSKSFLLKSIVAYETESYHEQALLKGIHLIDNVPYELAASADPNSIRIVIRNLITNAIKFSGENDSIEISASREAGQQLLIKIRDSGMGMSNEQRNKLFKSKVDSKTGTNNESGTGMGLLFCKDLVEKCNGKIWVTSEQGVGTEFSFTIPEGEIPQESLELV